MSARSFESSSSSKDSSTDCLKNYEIVERLEGGVSPEVYLATCKRGRLKRRTVVLKKVIATGRIQDSLTVHQALCHPTIVSLFSTLPADSDPDERDLCQLEALTTAAMPRYLVLEYCGPHGTLSDHLPRLNPTATSPLEESRIRGVIKTLADALVYLEKENVIHRRLVPENVYITEDFRAKLGGFEDAVRISSDGNGGRVGVVPVPEAEVGVPQYQLAPEIKAGRDYTCSSDLWSLGILILWMLDPSRVHPSRETQETAARANPIKTVRQESISNLQYSVHANRNGELGALISQLLEEVPERRIGARGVCGHAFLDPRLPVQNLDPSPGSGSRPHPNSTPSLACGSGGRQNEQVLTTLRKPHGLGMGRGKQKPKPFDAQHLPRHLDRDNDRTGYRTYFHNDIAVAGPSTSILPPRLAQVNRRVVSDPVYGTKERRRFLDPIEEVADEPGDAEGSPGPRVRFRSKSVTAVFPSFPQTRGHSPITADGDTQDNADDSSLENPIGTFGANDVERSLVQAEREKAKDTDTGMDTEELLGDFEEAFRIPVPSTILRRAAYSDLIHRIKTILETVVPESHSTPAASKPNITSRRAPPSPPSPLPPPGPSRDPFENPIPKNMGICVPRPTPLNASFLPPQTHKVARGQLVILPSRTLLVDFREGERRQGRRGVEVLTVSPDGEEIGVFSAPHMSSPCCLVEPLITYKLDDLPKQYWKLYTDAGKLVEQIKQHIPRLVLHEPDSRFTLMANFPDADVEAVFYSPDSRPRIQPSEGGEVFGKTNGGPPLRGAVMRIKIMRSRQLVEISRQVLAPARCHDRVMKSSSRDSHLREKEGEWKKVVLVTPGGNIDTIDRSSLDEYERKGLERTEGFLAVCSAVELGLANVGKPPRHAISPDSIPPSVLACKTLPVDQLDNNTPKESESIGPTRKLGRLTTASTPSTRWDKGCQGFSFDPSSLIQQGGGFETRFIPAVGWCVRYAGPSGGAGRYRMMFFDGKTLEVDVDEECVEMMDSVREEIVRYKIRECSSKREIMEKMQAFKEFVSMFDDGSDAE